MLCLARLLVVAAVIVAWAAPDSRAREFYIAGWNVENLFDTEDDPSIEGDEEYTPEGAKKWSEERLQIKLDNLAHAITKMNEGRGPDVLGVCEVENRKVVEMLVAKLAPLGRKYEIIHKDSNSDRGIDCAIIYDAGVFELVDHKFHYVDASKTRDIVEAKLRHDGKDLFVLMNHWPSRRNDEWQRCLAAAVLRKRLDDILANDSKADVLLLGDFNDETHNVSIEKFLRATGAPGDLADGAFFDTSAAIKEAGKGSYVFENKWDLIDHIIASPGLLDESGYRWKAGSTQRLEFPELFYQPRFPGAIARPSTSYSKDDFHKNGYSDHLALYCIIEQ